MSAVTPLLSIVKEKYEYLEENRYKASYIGRSAEDDRTILSGSMDLYFLPGISLVPADR